MIGKIPTESPEGPGPIEAEAHGLKAKEPCCFKGFRGFGGGFRGLGVLPKIILVRPLSSLVCGIEGPPCPRSFGHNPKP